MANMTEEGYLSPWLQRVRLKAATPHISGDVLDIGCGNGSLAPYCRPEAYYGIDIDDESLQVATKRHSRYNFSKNYPKDKKFDSVVMLAVIEHFPNPSTFVGNIKKHLRSNGKIIITTPHPLFDWAHRLGAAFGIFSKHGADEHEKLLAKKDIVAIAKENNLKLSHSKRFLFGANQLFILENNT